MGFISEETIQKVIAASDIVAVIQGYFPLKKAGPAWKALCPFHSERSPSFTVNAARQTFKCFGCGAGGGVVKFVEMHDHLSFPDAIRRLADRAGIPVVEEESDADALLAHRQRKELISLHREAMDWFHELLLSDPQAEPARRYWRSRGFDGQVARRWKIGFAPPLAATVLAWAQERKIAEKLLVEGGFISFGDEEGGRRRREPWFRFAGRLMFPIANDQGEVVGFSGRILDSEAQAAKYLNSPETPIFNKGRLFFGLDRSRRAIAKQHRAIVCEGQLDLIACVEAGVENMVAPLGTAFTEHHARLLRRLADECVLCFDSDTAGVKAAGRAFRELAKAGMFVRVADLPPGEDPDSLIRSQGAAALLQRVEEAKSFVDFQLAVLVRTTDMAQVRDRLRAAAELAGGIAALSEKAVQEDAINHAAVRLNVPADDLRRMVVRAVRDAAKEASRERRPTGDEAPASEAPVVISNRAVLLLCRLFLTDHEARHWLRGQEDTAFLAEMAETEMLRRLWELDDLNPADEVSVVTVLTRFTDAEQAFLSQLLGDHAPTRGVEDARVALLALKSQWMKGRIDLLGAHVREPGLSDAEKLRLTEEYMALSLQLRTLQGHMKLPASLIPF